MDLVQMKERCPDSKLLGKAFLNGYILDFTIFSDRRQCGCADIVKDATGTVWGLVYEVTEKDINSLDKAEGHPNHYRRQNELTVHTVDGKKYQVFSYEVVSKSETTLPTSQHYMGQILHAAITHNFPDTYIKSLKSFTIIDQ